MNEKVNVPYIRGGYLFSFQCMNSIQMSFLQVKVTQTLVIECDSSL